MLRTVLFAMLALSPAGLLSVNIEGPDEGLARAGERLDLDGRVWAEGPLGPMPGVGADVELEATGPGARWCELSWPGDLDTLEGDAPVELDCRPLEPGWANVTVVARSDTHGEDTWDLAMHVLPDLLDADLALGAVDAFRVPFEVRAVPQHLDEAPVNVTLRAELDSTPLVVHQGPFALDASAGVVLRGNLTASHGPGAYHLVARIEGRLVEPVELTDEFVVAEPEPVGEVELALTVTPAAPGLALTEDTVNANGKTKRPGDALVTRFVATDARTVNVTVARFVGTDRVVLARDVVQVGPLGEVEHRFAAPTVPVGPLVVEGRVGDALASRTGAISNAPSTAHIVGPTSALADGRCLTFSVRLNDSNFGSTALDPGPVWGLPDIRWRTFKGSTAVSGWTSELGPWNGTGEGTAETSRIAWPDGASWADVEDGTARMDLSLVPPRTATPGSYRVSIYDAAGTRLGGASFALVAPPRTALTLGAAIPGEDLVVEVGLADPVEGILSEVRATVAGLAWNATVTRPGQLRVPLPLPLAAGTPVAVEAWTTWPGRPAADVPDATATALVPALPPSLSVHASVDGMAVAAPLPVHPAGAHVVEVAYATSDANGDAVGVEAVLNAPGGAQVAWPVSVGDVVRVEVPAGEAPGRYALVITASAPDGNAIESLPLDVAPIARLGVEGAREATLAQNGQTSITLTVTNRGTVVFAGLLVDIDGPADLSATVVHQGTRYAANATAPVTLAPGASTQLVLELAAGRAPVGRHDLRVTVAGVLT